MSIEMVSIFSSLKKSFKRLLIFLPLIVGLLINPISANALYPSDPSSVDVLKDDLHGADPVSYTHLTLPTICSV